MNIRDRLTRMFSEPSRSSPVTPREHPCAGPGAANGLQLASLVGGEWQQQESGRLLYLVRDFSLDYRHGGIPLHGIYEIEPEMLTLLSGDSDFEGFDPARALFIDTETTGLAGGAGTYVFLIGLAYFDDHSFRVHQLFLPDLQSEQALLEETLRIADAETQTRFRYLISFNGKGYDLNLLENRFVLQRLPPPFGRLSHLDLLYPSRTLWKGSLESCALQMLERKLLGIYRRNDIPSALIPRIYFNFLRTGELRELPRIFEHNRLDLLTLVSLMALASRLVQEPQRSFFVDPVAAARMCRIRGNPARAAALLESACQKEEWLAQRPSLLLELVLLKRKLGRSDEALALCRQILQDESLPPQRAYEEAAKILEHHRRDLEGAYQIVTEALQIYADSTDLQHRLFRLQCRIAGQRWY